MDRENPRINWGKEYRSRRSFHPTLRTGIRCGCKEEGREERLGRNLIRLEEERKTGDKEGKNGMGGKGYFALQKQ